MSMTDIVNFVKMAKSMGINAEWTFVGMKKVIYINDQCFDDPKKAMQYILNQRYARKQKTMPIPEFKFATIISKNVNVGFPYSEN